MLVFAALLGACTGDSDGTPTRPTSANPTADWQRVESNVARVLIPPSLSPTESRWSIAYSGGLGERVWIDRVSRGGTLEARVDSAMYAITRSGAAEVQRDYVTAAGREGVRVKIARQGTFEWHWFFPGPGVFWSFFCRGPTDSRDFCDQVLSTLELIEP